MKKLFFALAAMAIVAVSCQKEFTESASDVTPRTEVEKEDSPTRSYEEALAIAERALNILETEDTRATQKRTIKRNEGQTVVKSLTRNGSDEDEPILYIFNNEDNAGFTVIAANKTHQPIIAVTESGNYVYGEPTGVEAFDLYMENVASTYSFDTPTLPLPEKPLVPKPGCYYDTIDIFTRVDPLLTTKWSQEGVFGAYCSNGAAGCAAVAAAQILAYHKHPDQLTLTYSNNEILNLDWNDILKHKKGELNQSDCYCDCTDHSQISHLLREVGKRMDMKYHADSTSGANPRDMITAFSSLGYTTPILETYVNGAAMKYTIRSELRNRAPVIVCGERDDEDTGHTWIIDGYHYKEYGVNYYVYNPNYNPDIIHNNPEYEYNLVESNIEIERMYHINWGFIKGTCNGWFDMTCYDPNNGIEYDKLVGTMCTASAYETIHVMYNIKPTYN